MTTVAVADDIAWERPDGSFPDHGGCVYLGPKALGDAGWGFADDLAAMQRRSKQTRQVLAMIPPRREARRAFVDLTSTARAAGTSRACSGIDDCVAQTAQAAGVALAGLTSDAEFLRRVRLDLTGRKVIEQDQGTRFIQIESLGRDHHLDILGQSDPTVPNIYKQTTELDPAFALLIEDLETASKLDETLVLACGEFGPTPGTISITRLGIDHHFQMFHSLAGGGVQSGHWIGSTNDIGGLGAGSFATEPGCSRGGDIGPGDIEATIYSALGIDWTRIRSDDTLNRSFSYVPSAEDDAYARVRELSG